VKYNHYIDCIIKGLKSIDYTSKLLIKQKKLKGYKMIIVNYVID